MTIQPLPQHAGELASSGLTLLDQARVRRALESSTSANTRRAYNQAWRRFGVCLRKNVLNDNRLQQSLLFRFWLHWSLSIEKEISK